MKRLRLWLVLAWIIWGIQIGFCQTLVDKTSSLGILQFRSDLRFGNGASCFDINQDGYLDLHLSTAAGTPDLIYLNQEGKGFQEVSGDFGLQLTGGSTASLWLDYDGDQLIDLLIANTCDTPRHCTEKNLQLFKQVEDKQFVDVTGATGLDIFNQAQLATIKGGLAAGDLNLDGYLDLVLTHWGGGEIFVFLNDGQGAFIESADTLGISGINEKFFQPLIWDFDGDGDLDIYVNVDAGPNRLFVNEHFKFQEEAGRWGLDATNNEMGISIGDYNNNGVFDLFMTNIDYEALFGFETGTFNVFYEGSFFNEQYSFRNTASQLGVKSSGWGWGTTFIDIDNDGFQDLAATNGVDDIDDLSKFWLNQSGKSYLDISNQIGFNDLWDGTTLLSLDYDRDGDLDLLQTLNTYTTQNISVRLLDNDASSNNNYLVVQPRMIGPNNYAIGATVKLQVGDQTMLRLITAGTSFYGQEAPEAHFGLGNASRIDKLEIIWPGGATSTWENVAANQIIEVSDNRVLHTPRFKESAIEQGKITVAWNHISTNETGFELTIADNPNFANAKSIFLSPDLKAQTIQEEATATNIYLRIRALNESLQSHWSEVLQLDNLIVNQQYIRSLKPVKVFPNPASDKISFSNLTFESIQLVNSLGQYVILKPTLNGQFSIEHLAAGYYFGLGKTTESHLVSFQFYKVD